MAEKKPSISLTIIFSDNSTKVLETLQREQITVLAGAPSLFVALTNDPAFAPEASSTMR